MSREGDEHPNEVLAKLMTKKRKPHSKDPGLLAAWEKAVAREKEWAKIPDWQGVSHAQAVSRGFPLIPEAEEFTPVVTPEQRPKSGPRARRKTK